MFSGELTLSMGIKLLYILQIFGLNQSKKNFTFFVSICANNVKNSAKVVDSASKVCRKADIFSLTN